jgi:hypothetical protein
VIVDELRCQGCQGSRRSLARDWLAWPVTVRLHDNVHGRPHSLFDLLFLSDMQAVVAEMVGSSRGGGGVF